MGKAVTPLLRAKTPSRGPGIVTPPPSPPAGQGMDGARKVSDHPRKHIHYRSLSPSDLQVAAAGCQKQRRFPAKAFLPVKVVGTVTELYARGIRNPNRN